MDALIVPNRMVWLRLAAALCVALPFAAVLSVTHTAHIFAADGSVGNLRNPCGPSTEIAVFKPLTEVQADIRIVGEALPPDCSEGLFSQMAPMNGTALGRWEWSETVAYWAPTELFFQPLYFDETAVERYGQTRSRYLQPGLSGLHFFGTVALLPVVLLAEHPCRCVSQLGYYRPGSWVPPVRERLRLGIDPLWLRAGTCLSECR